MTEPHTIYNCETCMFLTRNKKDYTRHLKSRKHLENHPTAPPPDATADTTLHCAKCNKEFKSRSAMYTHNKKCGSAAGAEEEATEEAAEASEATEAAALTPEQIQYIIMENKILKELLKNVIQGHHPAACPAPPNHSV